MSTADKTKMSPVPSADGLKIAIVVTEWNKNITSKLLKGAVSTLKKAKCKTYDVRWVPGALELPMGAQLLLDNGHFDAVIALGCVIRGGTPHFDYVCTNAFNGLMNVQLEFNVPITFGILTTDNLDQAMQRAGGDLGNKGAEAAEAAIKMATLQSDIIDEYYEDFYNDEEDDEDFDDIQDYIVDDNLLN